VVSRRGHSPTDRLPIIVTPQRRARNRCV
jgi:hypothetical protein